MDLLISILVWIVFGALAGWIASKIMKTDAQQGTTTDIIYGIVGAIVGGFIMQLLGFGGVSGANIIYSLIVAVLGASLLIWLSKQFAK
ncbi:GlsB/YeaQ/YmgE family stress response membrane protein [candidate division WWE3 bacterium]|uniref:GlsB/YeaQ/YmgE family stress response membrane protein n=1 Tax=candidate division WWE3 bacterium TaxID=2053526 RepID=A0A955LV78_UNCKA|nr:GlsB/YeaQ/YmgE family stress response membrane protein [candidate division WWE3 bacterium]